MLTIDLPGERTRCSVQKIHDDNHVVVSMDSYPLSRSHSFKQGDQIIVCRERGYVTDTWRPVDQRLLAVRELAATEPKPKVAKKRQRKVVPVKRTAKRRTR